MKAVVVRLFLAIGVLAAGGFAILVVDARIPPAHDECMRGIITVPASGSYACQVPVLFGLETSPIVRISIQQSAGPVSDMDVLVFREQELSDWKSGKPVTPLFQSKALARRDFVVRLPRSSQTLEAGIGLAKFYVVLSNRRSSVPKTIQAYVAHEWVPTSQILLRRGAIVILLAFFLFYALSLATWKAKPQALADVYAVPPPR